MGSRLRQIAKWAQEHHDPRKPKEIKADIDEKRSFIKDKVWPYLIREAKTIDKAKKLLYYSDWFIQETKKAAIMKLSKDLDTGKVEDLPPYEPISTKKDYEDEKLFLSLFHGRTLGDTASLIMGLKQGLEQSLEQAVKDNSLETVSTDTFIQD